MDGTIERALREARTRRSLPVPARRRSLRVGAGVTQAAVASVVGVTRPAIARYEQGSRTPRGVALERYLAVLERLANEPELAPNDERPAARPGVVSISAGRGRHGAP
jgi:transcriptional regulator with XRE-family HTH domain